MRVFTALIFLKNCFGNCYELNCVPRKFICWKSQTPVPQNVTLFGNKVFADVIKLRWGHTWTKCAPNPTQVVFYRKGKFGHRYTGGGGFPRGTGLKNLHTIAETQEMIVQSLGWQDPLEEKMVTHLDMTEHARKHTEEGEGEETQREDG